MSKTEVKGILAREELKRKYRLAVDEEKLRMAQALLEYMKEGEDEVSTSGSSK